MTSTDYSYIVVSPVYNEENYIEATIQGVLAQTVQPATWIIVDDGSTDQTATIVQQYASEHAWIRYHYRAKITGQSYYGSNVAAIAEGVSLLRDEDYRYLAVLDGDISLPPMYYETLLTRMEIEPKLGITSGVYMDRIDENTFRKVLNDRRSTPKAIMIFRRQCFEQIGGFLPLKYGYEDTCACYMARMKGWKTWSFPDVMVIHNKPVGTGHAKSLLQIRFRLGIGEYFCGSHPAFALLKSLRRCIKEKPLLTGGLARLAGYLYGGMMKEKRQVPDDLIQYIREEQISRIWNRFNTTTAR